MERAIRKQMYLTPAHNRLVKDLAAEWGTTEAAVVRKAIDGLAESEKSKKPDRRTEAKKRGDAILAAAGMLGGGGGPFYMPTRADFDRIMDVSEEERALLNRRTERLGGGSDVIAMREEQARIDAGEPIDD